MAGQNSIAITFSDGEATEIPADPDRNILEAAEAAGLLLASNCRNGTCRTCVSRDAYGEEVFLCLEPARGGLALTLPYRRAEVVQPTMRRAKINSLRKVCPSVWELRYRLQFPLQFLPGQYVEVSFPGVDGPRRFSMANAPGDAEQVLYIRDISDGATSKYFSERAKPEDAFSVRGPFGVFYLRATGKPKLFVSGGTGLAPILSMLRSQPQTSFAKLAIVAGFATTRDVHGGEDISTCERRLPLEVVLAADRTTPAWRGRHGTPVTALDFVRSVPIASGSEAYLCGPPGMVDAARVRLLDAGMLPEDIFAEEYIPSDAASAVP